MLLCKDAVTWVYLLPSEHSQPESEPCFICCYTDPTATQLPFTELVRMLSYEFEQSSSPVISRPVCSLQDRVWTL